MLVPSGKAQPRHESPVTCENWISDVMEDTSLLETQVQSLHKKYNYKRWKATPFILTQVLRTSTPRVEINLSIGVPSARILQDGTNCSFLLQF